VNIVPETLNQFYAQALLTQVIVAFVAMIVFGIVGVVGAIKIVGPAMATFKRNSENQSQLIMGLTDSNKAVAEMMRTHEANVKRIELLEVTTKTGDEASRVALKELTEGIGTLNTTITAIPQQLDQGVARNLQLAAETEGQRRNEALTGIVSEGVKSMEQHVDKAVGEAEARLDQKIDEITQAILDKIGELQKVVETKQADADVKRLIENLSADVDRRLRNLEMQFMTMKGNSAPPILEAFDGALKDNARSTPPEGTKVPMFDPQPFDTTGELIDSVKAIKPGEDGNE
jgi:hypothetical protein